MILTGIALIPWQLGDLIKQLVKTANQIQTLCPTCNLSTMPMLSSASSAALNGKGLKESGCRLGEMGRISLLPSAPSAPCPTPYSLRGTLDAALRYIAEFAAVLSQYGLCLGLSRLHDLPHLFAGLGKIHGSKAACLPDGFA